jgi:hypothetical protein
MDVSSILAGAASGAAAGSVVPGFGTLIGAVGGAALEIIGDHSVSDHLFGKDGASVAQKVVGLVQSVTGASAPGAQDAALAAHPELTVQLRIGLAQIAQQAKAAELADGAAARQADLAKIQAGLIDVQNARQQTVDLAKAASGVAWAPAIVSGIVLTTFGTVMWAALTRQLPAGSETIVNMLLGTLAAMASSVVSYWVGSSAGSAHKTQLLYQSQPALGAGATS